MAVDSPTSTADGVSPPLTAPTPAFPFWGKGMRCVQALSLHVTSTAFFQGVQPVPDPAKLIFPEEFPSLFTPLIQAPTSLHCMYQMLPHWAQPEAAPHGNAG